MAEATRIKRWRQRKREQGLKAITVWLTGEDEQRLKDLATDERCAPSQIVQRALAQYRHQPLHRSPTDTSLLHKQIIEELVTTSLLQQLIRDELTAIQDAPLSVSEGITVGPTVTSSYDAAPGHSLVTEPSPARRKGRPRSAVGQQILDLLAQHPEGLTAEQIRGVLTPTRPLGDILSGMRRLGTVRTEGEGRRTRYVVGTQGSPVGPARVDSS